MLSLSRCFCLHTPIARFHRIYRVAHSRYGPASTWSLHEKLRSHTTIQQRHRYDLAKHVRHGGFEFRNGVFIKPGDTVELKEGNFLRVKEVLHNEFHDIYWIVGWRFVWTKDTLGLSENVPNEVYQVVHLTKYNPQLATEQALVTVDDSQIVRKRRMNIVNAIYSDHQRGSGIELGAHGDGALYCRWKHVIVTKTWKVNRPLDAFRISARKITEASFQRLCAEECDDRHNSRTVDEVLRRSWLGGTKRGSADIESKETGSLLSAVDSLSLDDNSRNKCVPATYTFADVCCGGGGASRGAEMAGLQMRWALDHNAAACKTFRLNFPNVQLYHKPLKDVILMAHKDLKVDIMHISPPCQAFSLANTTPNLENDTLNIAANMEVGNCLDMARPRIATLEQTSGLMSLGHAGGRHSEHWSKLISQFTSRGYSVAWRIVDLAELGLPQRRKRLIMIASW